MKKILAKSVMLLILISFCSSENKSVAATIHSGDSRMKTELVNSSESVKTRRAGLEGTKQTNHMGPWVYDTARDKSGVYTPSAYTLSTKTLKLKAPYEGENRGKLIIMKNHDVFNLIIAIKKGRFSMDKDGKPIRVQFDSQDFETFESTKSNNDDPTMLFINNSESFIKKMRAAKKLTVEVEIEGNGKQLMSFDVAGLQW